MAGPCMMAAGPLAPAGWLPARLPAWQCWQWLAGWLAGWLAALNVVVADVLRGYNHND